MAAVGQPSLLPGMLFLALFFLGGIFLGQVLAGRIPDAAGQELSDYLRYYVELEEEVSPQAVMSALVLYFRYPFLAVLLGFSSIGVVLLPCITAAFGFFMSFSVSCFTAAFGVDGMLLALAVSGLRCAVTLPCYFLLAVPAWGTSAALASLSIGKGRRSVAVTYGRAWWLRLSICGTVLLAGMCVDLFCSTWFLRLALERVLA